MQKSGRGDRALSRGAAWGSTGEPELVFSSSFAVRERCLRFDLEDCALEDLDLAEFALEEWDPEDLNLRFHLATVTGPQSVESTWLIDTPVGMRSEEVALTLNQCSWQTFCTQGVVVGEAGSEHRNR